MADIFPPVIVEGDPNALDSFAACVTAVLRSWGGDVPYEFVEGLSGMAFSPIRNDGEDCVGWKMDGCNEQRVDFLGKCLGFRVERVERAGEDAWLDGYKRPEDLPPEPAAYFARLHEALRAGDTVVCRTWPAWSVLLDWQDDILHLPFATMPRFDKVVASIYPPCKTRLAFVLSQRAPEISRQQAITQAIAFGYLAASGELSCDTGGVLFGGAIFDTMIENTGMQYLCPSCKENGCMGRSFKRIHDGQRASIHFLTGARDYVRGQAGWDALDGAILAYSEMCDISSKYLDWQALRARHDLPEFRSEIAHACAMEKALQARAAQYVRELGSALEEIG
ncbi:MAG: hypothetical protein MUC51_08145 [Anaerolineae bacterium]|nr:hypothetical protein [Anaerolineae bacterium]